MRSSRHNVSLFFFSKKVCAMARYVGSGERGPSGVLVCAPLSELRPFEDGCGKEIQFRRGTGTRPRQWTVLPDARTGTAYSVRPLRQNQHSVYALGATNASQISAAVMAAQHG